MTRRRACSIGVSTVVAVLLLVVWWRGADEGPPHRRASALPAATIATTPPATPSHDARARTPLHAALGRWLLPDPRRTRRVAGVVLHDGAPVQAVVRVSNRARELRLAPEQVVRTAADGRFDLGELPVELLRLRAQAGTAIAIAEIDLARDPAPDQLTLHVAGCATTTAVRVVDLSDQPIAGADLLDLRGFVIATTDGKGEADLCGDEVPALRVIADGYGSRRLPLDGASRTVVLPPEAVVTGDVVDREGRAIADALVFTVPVAGRLDLDHVIARTLSGPDGRFELRGLAPGVTRVAARTRGGSAAPLEVALEAGAPARASLVIVSGVTVRGTIQSGGRPMPDTRLVLRDRAEVAHPLVSDARGAFEIDGVAEGPARLLNIATHIPIIAPRDIVIADGSPPLAIELAPVVEITARVVDPRPVPGAIVSPRCTPAGGDALQRTGPEGLVTLWVPAGARCELLAAVDASRAGTSAPFETGPPVPAPITISLPPRSRAGVDGEVRDAADAPAAGLTVRLRADGVEHVAASGPDGRWALRGLAPAVYAVSVHAGPHDVPADIVPDRVTVSGDGGDAQVRIRLRSRAHRLAGTVIDAAGRPVPDAVVDAVPAALPAAPRGGNALGSLMAAATALTDEHGAFALTLVAPGAYRLEARAAPGAGTVATEVPAPGPIVVPLTP